MTKHDDIDSALLYSLSHIRLEDTKMQNTHKSPDSPPPRDKSYYEHVTEEIINRNMDEAKITMMNNLQGVVDKKLINIFTDIVKELKEQQKEIYHTNLIKIITIANVSLLIITFVVNYYLRT